MYEITRIKVSRTPPTLDTITQYFFEGKNGETNTWVDKPAGVKFVTENPQSVYVSGGGSRAFVEVVSNGSSPFLRTEGDGTTSDNLLSQTIYS
jgi:hypothetical protein